MNCCMVIQEISPLQHLRTASLKVRLFCVQLDFVILEPTMANDTQVVTTVISQIVIFHMIPGIGDVGDSIPSHRQELNDHKPLK